MNPIVTLTDAAIVHIKEMIHQQPGSIGFRLSIKKMGCTGYSYAPTIIKAINPNDIFMMAQDNLPVYIDSTYQQWFEGLLIDYGSDNTIGIKQKKLIYINPNEKNRCGCGESFGIE